MPSIEPLYQQLKKEVLSVDLSVEQKEDLVKTIKSLDEEGNEIIYILIRLYELDSKSKCDELPYESKFSSKELKFDIENIPTQLRWIIHKFSKKHVNKMSEEREFKAKMHFCSKKSQ